MNTRAFVVIVLIAPALAGCLGTPSPAAPSSPWEDTRWSERALAAGHDHADPVPHANLTTPNFEILGWSPLISDAFGTTMGAHCGDVAERDGRRLAVTQDGVESGGVVFTLADITDAANPRYLGEFVLWTVHEYDVAMVADGRHVAVVTRAGTHLPEPLPLATPPTPSGLGLWWRSPCAGPGLHPLPGFLGAAGPVPHLDGTHLLLVDVADASQPRIVDEKPLVGYGHGVSSAEIGGRVLVVASALGMEYAPVADVWVSPAWTQNFHFYEVVPGPQDAQLEFLSVFTPPVPLDPGRLTLESGHADAWITVHPVLERPVAWIAASDAGVYILDLQDPSEPRLIGQWSDYDPARPADSGAVHSVFALPALWPDGRHYTVVGPEFGSRPVRYPTGVVHVLDTTDPARPFEVAAWTLPHDIVWEDHLQFSPHYMSVVGRTLFVSMYHGGIWAIDLSGIGEVPFLNLASVGVFMPVNVSPAPHPEPTRWAPTLEEALALADGTLVTFDRNSGVYTFRLDETRPMPAPTPWPIEPVPGPGGTAGGGGTP